MPINISAIDLHSILWLVGLIVVALIILGIVRFFFRHLLHLVFRGCGVLLLIILALIVLHSLKVF